jgi:hypothetical protein
LYIYLSDAPFAQFSNEDAFDFSDVADKTPVQEFDVAQGREVGEYALRCGLYLCYTTPPNLIRTAKFSNVSSVSLYFPASQGADTTKIFYVGFLGTWTEVCFVSSLFHLRDELFTLNGSANRAR